MEKKAIPEQFVAPGAIHSGDGWCWRPNPDGTVTVYVINPMSGSRVETLLTSDEWARVERHIRPPAPIGTAIAVAEPVSPPPGASEHEG